MVKFHDQEKNVLPGLGEQFYKKTLKLEYLSLDLAVVGLKRISVRKHVLFSLKFIFHKHFHMTVEVGVGSLYNP